MNLDELDKQWQDGDDAEELKTEKEVQFERLEQRRKEAAESAGTFDPRCWTPTTKFASNTVNNTAPYISRARGRTRVTYLYYYSLTFEILCYVLLS